MEPNNLKTLPTRSLSVSCQAITVTSSISIQENEKIPIHRYLTLKTIESKIVYCLTFFYELLPDASKRSQKQGVATSDLEQLAVKERAMS